MFNSTKYLLFSKKKKKKRTHAHKPQHFLYKIKINPAMAFGTGHHESTQLMIENMLEYDIGSYHKVIDLGCGSGVLSILASKMGCDNIIAIDNDSICKDNFLENCQLNSWSHE